MNDSRNHPSITHPPGDSPASFENSLPSKDAHPTNTQFASSALAATPPKKIWPLVLGACLITFFVALAGIAGLGIVLHSLTPSITQTYPTQTLQPPQNKGITPNQPTTPQAQTFTLAEIKEGAGKLPQNVSDNRASAGVYEVGPGKDLAPGQYFLDGTAATESAYYVFDQVGSSDTYRLKDSFVYFGNYFADLAAGEVVVYLPHFSDAYLYPAKDVSSMPPAPFSSKPLLSGLYRVGKDIPAGTYRVFPDQQAGAAATQKSQVFVMKDLAFGPASMLLQKPLTARKSQMITVKDGQYLELYAAKAKVVK